MNPILKSVMRMKALVSPFSYRARFFLFSQLILFLSSTAFSDSDASKFGFVRVAAVSPVVAIGNPLKNVERILKNYRSLGASVTVALYPEMALTGYTIETRVRSDQILEDTRTSVLKIIEAQKGPDAELLPRVMIVGGPYRAPDGRLFNATYVISGGRVLGVVPKSYLPTYGEFYDEYIYSSGESADIAVNDPELGSFRVAPSQLFSVGKFIFGIEICEDLFAPDPPHAKMTRMGAQVIFNASASNELMGKAEDRRDLVKQASSRQISGYVYASAGPTESTKDAVYGGHSMIAQDGAMLAQSERFLLSGTQIVQEIDIQQILYERSRNTTWGKSIAAMERKPGFHPVQIASSGLTLPPITDGLIRKYSRFPFVPTDPKNRVEASEEVLEIQATGLARRLLDLYEKYPGTTHHIVIGVSGGLDSTLALLVAERALKKIGRTNSDIIALTLPGFGTSSHTFENAKSLMRILATQTQTISIVDEVVLHLKEMGLDANAIAAQLRENPRQVDKKVRIAFENAQARQRTRILMDMANLKGGIVLGTGDLSELVLGYCTFSGDHISHYNVNCGVPKTLIKHLVKYSAETTENPELATVLHSVAGTVISAELIPTADDGRVTQVTENEVGSYDLHDFYIQYFIRSGFSPEKVFYIASQTFLNHFTDDQILDVMKKFFTRFDSNQFKRTMAAAGPKALNIDASPRASMRLPDEMDCAALLGRVDAMQASLADRK